MLQPVMGQLSFAGDGRELALRLWRAWHQMGVALASLERRAAGASRWNSRHYSQHITIILKDMDPAVQESVKTMCARPADIEILADSWTRARTRSDQPCVLEGTDRPTNSDGMSSRWGYTRLGWRNKVGFGGSSEAQNRAGPGTDPGSWSHRVFSGPVRRGQSHCQHALACRAFRDSLRLAGGGRGCPAGAVPMHQYQPVPQLLPAMERRQRAHRRRGSNGCLQGLALR